MFRIQLILSKGIWIVLMVIGSWLNSCGKNPSEPAPSSTPPVLITPFSTFTQTRASRTPFPINRSLSTPHSPTATPLTYTVVKNDTMLGIALRYGISLEELQVVNPQVDPRYLSVGAILIIPFGENSAPILATPTPLPVKTNDPICFRALDGIWCFLLLMNDSDESIENLSARFVLYDPDGKEIAQETAFAPLNLLRAGDAMPVMVFVPSPGVQDFIPDAELLSALVVAKEDDRYLAADLKINRIEIDPTGVKATAQGVLSLPKKSQPANQIWLALVAYGVDGNVVGVRKWEVNGPLEPGTDLPYEVEVYSLGPRIDRVEVLDEVRP